MTDISKQRAEYQRAVESQADCWVPACGGAEVPFEYNGNRWLYVWNPAEKIHGYLNLDNDTVTTEIFY